MLADELMTFFQQIQSLAPHRPCLRGQTPGQHEHKRMSRRFVQVVHFSRPLRTDQKLERELKERVANVRIVGVCYFGEGFLRCGCGGRKGEAVEEGGLRELLQD